MPDILRLTGLSTKLHNYPDQLSGGEQQRVSIARAFVNHPPLLLADEPTGNLDPETSIDIMRLLYRINRTGTTVLVATHDQAMVDKMRRRVLELSAGPDRPRRGGRPVHARRDHARVRASAPARARRRRPPGLVDAMKIGFFLREAMRAMRRSAAPSFAALATVLVTMLVLGRVHPDRAGDQRGRQQRPRPRRGRRLHEDERDRRRRRPGPAASCSALPHVKSVQFVSKQQAYQQQ